MYQLQLASNKELDLFMYASGGRKIMENIFKAPSVLGINEILSDILKKKTFLELILWPIQLPVMLGPQ